jgi:malonyl-CoA/methylmalonyl-CoA synthetase
MKRIGPKVARRLSSRHNLHGQADLIVTQNLFAALRAQFPADRSTCAVETDQGHSYCWQDLDSGSARIANLLHHLGLSRGARVVAQVDKSVEVMMLYLAALRAGYVFVPLNTAYQSAEIEYFLSNAEPAVVVCSTANLDWIRPIASQCGTAEVLTLNQDRSGTLLERAAHFSDDHEVVASDTDDLAAILYTSGTTGRSKGAMLSHGNLLSNALTLKTYWAWQPGDVLIHALPIFHVHGLFVAVHGALLNGSKMIWLASFDAKRVIAKMPEATIFMGVPTLYVRMLAEPSLTRAQAAGMRLFVAGSAPLQIETFQEWQERTGHTILERYGMSETGMLTSNPYRSDPRYGEQAERRGGTVGFAMPGVQLRVCTEEGEAVAAGQIGGIQVKGANVFAGYWRMPEKTREEFTADGFFKTGDLGRIDERGYVSIVGRSKDLIISGGLNVYPAEIEGYINEMPGVAESALVGVPHPDFGEVGVAVVVAKAGADVSGEALIATLKSRLANFKIPKRCYVVDALPRNAMGKVQKNLLREQYSALF